MLLSVQSFDVEELGIHRRSWAIDAPGLWVRLVRQVGMGADERLVRLLGYGRPPTSRNLVGIVLRGDSFVSVAGGAFQEMIAGDVVLLPGRASLATRLEATDAASFSLTIELDREVWGDATLTPSLGRLSDEARVDELAGSLCVAIERAWAEPSERALVDRALADLFACLREDGLPLPRIDSRAFASLPSSLSVLGRSVDRALSQTGSRAMLVDVETDGNVCARTLQRSLPALCALWGQSVESFREHTRRTLLARACWAMTNPRATTERIAHAVGFSTPNAFCRAMATYGLPSPGRVRERFVALA
ncbi:MAG TPA: hypothetical protein VLT33_29010 [Labilithrix sp.]|nr:hypothetical protein [Labilithrix sp.]